MSKKLIIGQKFKFLSKNSMFGQKFRKTCFLVQNVKKAGFRSEMSKNVENINIWSKTLKSRWYVIGTSNDDDLRTDH